MLRRDRWVSVRYAEERHAGASSASLGRPRPPGDWGRKVCGFSRLCGTRAHRACAIVPRRRGAPRVGRLVSPRPWRAVMAIPSRGGGQPQPAGAGAHAWGGHAPRVLGSGASRAAGRPCAALLTRGDADQGTEPGGAGTGLGAARARGWRGPSAPGRRRRPGRGPPVAGLPGPAPGVASAGSSGGPARRGVLALPGACAGPGPPPTRSPGARGPAYPGDVSPRPRARAKVGARPGPALTAARRAWPHAETASSRARPARGRRLSTARVDSRGRGATRQDDAGKRGRARSSSGSQPAPSRGLLWRLPPPLPRRPRRGPTGGTPRWQRGKRAPPQQGPHRQGALPQGTHPWPAWAALVACWWAGVRQDVAVAAVACLWWTWTPETLGPPVSGAHHGTRPRGARRKAKRPPARAVVSGAGAPPALTRCRPPPALGAGAAWATRPVQAATALGRSGPPSRGEGRCRAPRCGRAGIPALVARRMARHRRRALSGGRARLSLKRCAPLEARPQPRRRKHQGARRH